MKVERKAVLLEEEINAIETLKAGTCDPMRDIVRIDCKNCPYYVYRYFLENDRIRTGNYEKTCAYGYLSQILHNNRKL